MSSVGSSWDWKCRMITLSSLSGLLNTSRWAPALYCAPCSTVATRRATAPGLTVPNPARQPRVRQMCRRPDPERVLDVVGQELEISVSGAEGQTDPRLQNHGIEARSLPAGCNPGVTVDLLRYVRWATRACSLSASSAIFAFSTGSIFRLVFRVIVRSV
jgi:hypothetical protein